MKLRQKILKAVGRILFDHKKKQKLEIKNLEKIIFIQNRNKIGDMLVYTHVFRELKNKYPSVEIDILGGKSNTDILDNNKYINKVYKMKNMFSIFKVFRKGYDVCYYHTEENHHIFDFLILNLIGAKVNIARNKNEFNLIDISIDGDFSESREIDKFNALLNVLEINPKQEKYDIFLTDSELYKAKQYVEEAKINIVFNRFGSKQGKTLNTFTSLELIKIILKTVENVNVILIGHSSKLLELEELRNQFDGEIKEKIKTPVINSIRESAALISLANLVVTPDTSIVHIACAFEKKLIALYRKKSILWEPIISDASVIYSQKKEKKDVNYISLEEFESVLKKKLSD